MSEPGGELSQYEQLSALTPKKMPYAILIGGFSLVPLLILLNYLAPNEALKEAKEKKAEEEAPAQVQSGEELEDI